MEVTSGCFLTGKIFFLKKSAQIDNPRRKK